MLFVLSCFYELFIPNLIYITKKSVKNQCKEITKSSILNSLFFVVEYDKKQRSAADAER